MRVTLDSLPGRVSKCSVALINPPYFERYSRSQRSPGVIKSGTMYYPYWLAHAAALLDQRGFPIYLYDCPAANMRREALLSELMNFQPRLAILETSTASAVNDCKLAAELKVALPGLSICMVGTHVTALWEETLRGFPGVDFVAIGEYDGIVAELAELLNHTAAGVAPALSELGAIAALGFRLADGTPARGPVRPPIEDVDGLPWIAPIYQRFLNPENYYFSLASHPMVMLIGGRGCVAKCTYCVYPQVMHGHAYRTRSPESVVGEMKWIQDHLPQVKEIVFEDDTFTGDRDYAKRVAELVREKGVTLPWFANVRTNTDRETLSLMKQAGFRCCATGFESGDDILLKNMWKGQTLEGQRRFVQNCRELGILVHGCFMVGFPGESPQTMEKTLQLALELRPDSAQFYPVMPFPGTTYFKWAQEQGYLATQDFTQWLNDEGGHRCVLNLPGLRAEEIEHFCEKAYLRFHFRPKYLLFKGWQALRKPREGIRSVKSFLFFLFYLLTSRKKERPAPFSVPSIAVPEGWYRMHSMPKGRMFEQTVQLRELQAQVEKEGTVGTGAKAGLRQLAEKDPSL